MRPVHHVEKVSKQAFEGMHRVASQKDLNEGGLFDARGGGAINIWCGPDDKPEGYGYEIVEGALDYPRDFIGEILPEYEDNKVSLELTVNPSRGGTEIRETVQPTRKEKEWTIEKMRELIEAGKNEGVLEKIIVCPECGEVQDVKLFNRFVNHLIEEHDLSVVSVNTTDKGIKIELEDGRVIAPGDYLKKRPRR